MELLTIFVSNNSILSLIGKTPVIDISFFSPNPKVKILAKLENRNPSGCYKDRVALAMVNRAEKLGLLKKGDKIIEPTSGNTGISLAFISAIKNYDFTALMPSSMSMERRELIKAFGGKVKLKKASEAQIVKHAKKIAKRKGYYLPNQFENPANIEAAYKLGIEINNQVENIDKFIAGIGTGGTITGVGEKLKLRSKKDGIEIIGFYSPNEKIQGTINLNQFIPKNLDLNLVDDIYAIKNKTAIKGMNKLWDRGIFVGLSSGAALELAIRESKKMSKGKIMLIFADSGNRYLSLEKNKKGHK